MLASMAQLAYFLTPTLPVTFSVENAFTDLKADRVQETIYQQVMNNSA